MPLKIDRPGKAVAFLLLAALLRAGPVCAQGCALCYTQAAGASERLIQALRGGILLLIFPPLAISAAIVVAAYRKRNRFNNG